MPRFVRSLASCRGRISAGFVVVPRVRYGVGFAALATLAVGAAPARAQSAPPVIDLCAGPRVTLPTLTSVSPLVDTSALAAITNPLLSGLAGSVNANLTGALSGQQLSASLIDANRNVVSVPAANCSVGLSAPGGIAVGGGRIVGLGGGLGSAATAGDATAVALGNGSVATPAGALALGTGASATSAGGVALGAGAVANRLNGASELFSGTALRTTIGAVSVGATGAERQIVNVAGGTLDTDAVNLRQLRTVGAGLAAGLGGGAGFSNLTGAFTAPSYLIGGNSYRDVGSALAALGSLSAATGGLVGQVAAGAPVTIGGATDGALVSLRGTVGDRVLTGLAAGAVTARSTDAVNGGQLARTNAALAANVGLLGGGASLNLTTGALTLPTFTVGGRAFADVASALASIQVNVGLPTTPGQPTGPGQPAAPVPSLVQQASATAPITVGALTGGTSVDFTGTSGARTLTGIAGGRIAAESTDAVNGGQLFGTNQRLDALAATAVQYDVMPGTGQKGNSLTLAGGDPSAPVLLRNVADGTLASDATNVGQLRAAQQAGYAYTDTRAAQTLSQANTYADTRAVQTLTQANTYTDARAAQTLGQANAYTDLQVARAASANQAAFQRLNQDVATVRREARQAAAVGLAASALRYDDHPGKLSLAAGGAGWRGEAGAAFGLGYTTPDGFARMNAAATTSGSDWGVSGGLSLTLN